MRLFVAIDVGPEVRARAYRDTGALRAAAPDVAWVRPDLLHITLKFLGEVADPILPALVDAVGAAVRGYAAFRVRLEGIGAFPSLRRPRVVWLGAGEDAAVASLARTVDGACASLGFARDDRAFTTHVTLGRVRHALGAGSRRALEEAARKAVGGYDVAVRAVDVMQSEPTPKGSRYTVLASLPLGAE